MTSSPSHPDIEISTKKGAAEQIRDILNQPGIPVLHKLLHARGLAESHLYNMPRYPTSDERILVENHFIRRVLELLGPRNTEISQVQQTAILTEMRALVIAAIETKREQEYLKER